MAYWYWNPARELFTIPFFHFSIYWYSIWFVIGIYGSIRWMKQLLRQHTCSLAEKQAADLYLDKLATYSIFGIIIGARLGHVLFYDCSFYLNNPLEILNIRSGGLASHGAFVGICLAVWYVQRQAPACLPKGFDLLDGIAIVSSWTAICIRLGNFWNQEILGTVTNVPWAVIFGAYGEPLPRHPVQLYEALAAAILCITLYIYTRKRPWAQNGRIAGWYLLLLFLSRIALEYYKAPQSTLDINGFSIGQLLSLPILIIALACIIRARGSRMRL